MSPAAQQLSDEAATILFALGPITGEYDAMVSDARCAQLAADLTQVTDDRLAAEACLTIMLLLWPARAPEDCGAGDWWRTPLGRLCARSIGRDGSDAITYSVAAAMLGVARGTVSVWVQRGTLDRHPDGGVLRSSVMARLGR